MLTATCGVCRPHFLRVSFYISLHLMCESLKSSCESEKQQRRMFYFPKTPATPVIMFPLSDSFDRRDNEIWQRSRCSHGDFLLKPLCYSLTAWVNVFFSFLLIRNKTSFSRYQPNVSCPWRFKQFLATPTFYIPELREIWKCEHCASSCLLCSAMRGWTDIFLRFHQMNIVVHSEGSFIMCL